MGKIKFKTKPGLEYYRLDFLINRGNFSPPGFVQDIPVPIPCLSLLVSSQVSILNAPCQHGLGMTDGADSTQLDFLESRLLLQSWQLRQISLRILKWTTFDEEVTEGAGMNMRQAPRWNRGRASHCREEFHISQEPFAWWALAWMCSGIFSQHFPSCAGVSEPTICDQCSFKPEEGALPAWALCMKSRLNTPCQAHSIILQGTSATLFPKAYFQTSHRSFLFHISWDRG